MSKAFGFKGYGGPEVQGFVDVPKPDPGPGEVLVAVRAAGVNPADWKLRAGNMRQVFPLELPAIFGYEVAGVVEAVGPDVEGLAVGDEVFGSVMGGGYAQYAVVPVQNVARKPAEVSFTDAAALPVAAATAFDGLTQLGLAAGQTLLIVGVGGGSGWPRPRSPGTGGSASSAPPAQPAGVRRNPRRHPRGLRRRGRRKGPGRSARRCGRSVRPGGR